MHRRARLLVWALVVGAFASLSGAARAEVAAGVAGRVLAASHPVADATVYAYQVVEKSLRQVLTDGAGEFHFGGLPAGLYKIIATKSGFAPVVTVVTRRAPEQQQFLQVELPAASPRVSEDFWSLRAEVPADVLRQLDGAGIEEILVLVPASARPAPDASVLTEVVASTSVGVFQADTRAQLSSGQVGLRGRLGNLRLAVDGDFKTLAAAPGAVAAPAEVAGESTALRIQLEGKSSSQLDVAAESHRLITAKEGQESPVDFDRFLVRYRRDLGNEGSTALLAQYVDETGLYGGARLHPLDLPAASRALRLEGSYVRDIGLATHLRTGLRFRESVRDYTARRPAETGADVLARSIDAWSYADWELDPTYVVQYGVFTSANDGTVSLAPRGGMLVRFHPGWQASVSASHRIAISEGESLRGEFAPATLETALGCDNAEASCYEVQLLNGTADASRLRVGGSWREFDRTVRLFLHEDLFAAAEGLFLVPGDELPEVHATLRQELGDHAVASWTSSYARGGGGVFRAANLRFYENQIGTFSSVLTTTYRPTATGVYVSFHRIAQKLQPLRRAARRGTPDVALEAVELAVSQDLSRLLGLHSDWAVRLGFELLRGQTLFDAVPVDAEELRHRVTTGVAVRF